MLKCPK